MKKLSVNLIASVLSLWCVSQFIDTMHIDSFKTLIILTLLIGVLNVFMKPIIKLFTLPINLLTLGLFSFVINAVILKIAFHIIPGAELSGFISAIISSILLSITNCIISNILD